MSEWPERQEIEEKLENAFDRLLECDRFLLEKDVNERSISHKLASYLQDEFGNEWDVDCEYNRDHDVIKELTIMLEAIGVDDTTATTVFPDIIVHHRGSEDNLLVIEIKKTSNVQKRTKTFDLDKLRAFKGKKYHYRHALYLQIKTGPAIKRITESSLIIDETKWQE